MTIPYIVVAVIVFLYVFYKLKLENRYSWKQWDDDVKDPNGVLCSRIVYTDKHLDGLQIEYFYNIQMSSYLASAHINSKNKAYRRSIISRYTNK